MTGQGGNLHRSKDSPKAGNFEEKKRKKKRTVSEARMRQGNERREDQENGRRG